MCVVCVIRWLPRKKSFQKRNDDAGTVRYRKVGKQMRCGVNQYLDGLLLSYTPTYVCTYMYVCMYVSASLPTYIHG